jgi:hypothetical protein
MQATLPWHAPLFLPMEPRIQTDLLDAGARYFLPPMVRPQVVLASVIPVAPHDCASGTRVHAQRLPILAQPIEASSTTALPCGQIPACLQERKDCLQSTLVTFATGGRTVVVVAFVLLASHIASRLQLL